MQQTRHRGCAHRNCAQAGQGGARHVHERGKRVEVEEEGFGEVKPLPEVEPAEVAPDHEANGVDRPGAALLEHVGDVLGTVLTDRADDREVAASPSAPERFDARLEILDQIPRREAADVLERFAAPHQARSAWKDRVGEVAREHLAAVELAVEVHERIASRDLRLLDRLHERESLVELKLADRVAQKVEACRPRHRRLASRCTRPTGND